jgi:hypothetical protein
MAAAGLSTVDIPMVEQVQTAGVQRSIRFESQALWVLCVLVALAALAVLGRVSKVDLSREMLRAWDEET